MLKYLRKHFDASASQPSVQTETLSADAENQEDVNMTKPTDVQTDAVSNADELASVKASLEAANTELTSAKTQIEQLTSQLSSFKEAQVAAENAAKEAKLKARSDKAVAALGTEKAEKLLAATSALDDPTFETILAVSSNSLQDESKTELFKETGVEGNADQAALASSTVLQALQDKYLKPSTTK